MPGDDPTSLQGPALDRTESLPVDGETVLADANPPAPPGGPFSLRPGDTMGRYIVLNQIGAGGMGEVYAAYDPELDRKLAIKLLRSVASSSSRGTEGRARLLREAQAMARLSHPNVVAVHDVGTFGEQVFVAMEFVEGSTLRAWVQEQPRKWREVLQVFLRAGRGLAAAHAAGLVHRDFKPDNVLLGKDGRVRVADFGLARPATPAAASEAKPPPSAAPAEGVISTAALSIDAPLTRTGAVLGTPAYMSPEQHRGEATDARTDQFSFCVALYEALYEERPFGGDTAGEVAREVTAGRVRDPPRDSGVPVWVRRVLVRGLAPKPEDRYPSMDALLAELSKDPRAARRRALTLAAAVIIAGGVVTAYFQLRADSAAPCRGAERKLAGVWDDKRRQEGRTAFMATRKPYAESAWSAVSRALERYTQSFVAMHTDACEATAVRGEQSQDVLDLRMECLDERLKQVRAVTNLFMHADAQVVERSGAAVRALVPLQVCADLAALQTRVKPPRDAAIRAKVEGLKTELEEAKALKDAGKYRQGLEIAKRTAAAALGLEYRPIRAEALLLRGELEDAAGEFKVAEDTLQHALWEGEAGRHDKVAAAAAVRLVCLVGFKQAQYAKAEALTEHASAAVERYGKEKALVAELLSCQAAVQWAEGKQAEALRLATQSLALREELFGPEDVRVAVSLTTLGTMLASVARYDEALAHHQRAVAINEKALGSRHPTIATSLHHLGSVLLAQARHAEARDALERALSIRTAALGQEHPAVATTLSVIGGVAREQGRYADAASAFRRALEIREKTLGADHPDVALARSALGDALHDLGGDDEALAEERRALATLETALGREHPEVALTLERIGAVLHTQSQYEEAVVAFERALTIREKALGPEHPDVAVALTHLAWARVRKGRPEEALRDGERALRIEERTFGRDHPSVARTRVGMGDALFALGKPEEALASFLRAIEILEKSFGGEHPEVGRALSHQGRRLQRLGRNREALVIFERALAIATKAFGGEHPRVAAALAHIGEVQTALGAAAPAAKALERALSIRQKHAGDPVHLARTQFALARALWLSPPSRDRARSLLREARSLLAARGEAAREELGELEVWRARAR
jgi:tetratricopeptide (TPR) repeat protein